MKSANDNIGHEAHLGGAILGMVIAGLLFPGALIENFNTVALIAVPMSIFLILLFVKPDLFQAVNSQNSHTNLLRFCVSCDRC